MATFLKHDSWVYEWHLAHHSQNKTYPEIFRPHFQGDTKVTRLLWYLFPGEHCSYFFYNSSIIYAVTNRMVISCVCMYSIFLLIVLTTVRAKYFRYPVLLPPGIPPHILTYLITMVDAVSWNAVPLIEPCRPLHYFHLLKGLWKHVLDIWKLEFVIYQSRKPNGAQLRRVKIRNALNITHKGHVWNQWMDSSPVMMISMTQL